MILKVAFISVVALEIGSILFFAGRAFIAFFSAEMEKRREQRGEKK